MKYILLIFIFLSDLNAFDLVSRAENCPKSRCIAREQIKKFKYSKYEKVKKYQILGKSPGKVICTYVFEGSLSRESDKERNELFYCKFKDSSKVRTSVLDLLID